MLLGHLSDNSVEFIVHDEYETGAYTSEDVSGGSLEEGGDTSFVFVDLGKAVHGAIVEDISTATLHHQSPPDGVEGVAHDTRGGSDYLCEHELQEQRGGLVVLEQ